MLTMMIIMMFCSMLFLFLKHPLSLGFILLIQTLLISLSTGLLNLNFWFSYILFLIMVGGMLILFIYMTSIASNEKFKFSMNLLLMSLIFMMSMIMSLTIESFIMNMNINIIETYQQFFHLLFNKNFNKYFNFPLNKITYMIIIYLFITLIMTTKLTMINKGPLRQKN